VQSHTSEEDGDVRSMSKLDMLERQLEELKRMLEMQQQLAAMTAARGTANASTPSSIIEAPQTGLRDSGIPTAPRTSSFSVDQNIMAAAKGIQLRKASSVGIASGTRRHANAHGDATSGLQGVLRSAMDRRFQTLAKQVQSNIGSPASDCGSDTTGSPFGSPASPRAKNSRRLTTTSASFVANAARRSSRGGIDDLPNTGRRHSPLVGGDHLAVTPRMHKRSKRAQSRDVIHDFSPLSPPSEPEMEPQGKKTAPNAAQPPATVADAKPAGPMGGLLAEIRTFTRRASVDENVAPKVASAAVVATAPAPAARPMSMLAAIKGFDKNALKAVASNKEGSDATDAELPAAALKAMASPPKGGFNPADISRITLKKTGAKFK
jgi:ribosomal protein L13E